MYDYGNNYGYGYSDYDTTTSLFGGLFASMGLMLLISAAVGVLMLISQWKIYKKAGKNGWECLVPIYNIIVLLQIVELPMWYIALFFVPFANIYAMFKIYIELAHKFGKSTGFGVLTVFFSVVCLPILAFGKDNVYEGGNSQVNPVNTMNNQFNQFNPNNLANFQNPQETVMFNPTANTNINPIPEPMVNNNQTIPEPIEPVMPTPIVNAVPEVNVNPTITPVTPEPVISTPVDVMPEPATIEIPQESIIPEPMVNNNQTTTNKEPIEPVMPTPIVNVVPEVNVNPTITPVTPEPVINNPNTPVNEMPEPVTIVNPTQVIPQEPVVNNFNNPNNPNNQNM